MTTSRDQAFDEILGWLQRERSYQAAKWQYGDEPPDRLQQGLDEGSWFWQTGVLNYVGRIRVFGLGGAYAGRYDPSSGYLGRQALMKLIATLVHLAELAIVEHGHLPEAGYTSGEIVEPH